MSLTIPYMAPGNNYKLGHSVVRQVTRSKPMRIAQVVLVTIIMLFSLVVVIDIICCIPYKGKALFNGAYNAQKVRIMRGIIITGVILIIVGYFTFLFIQWLLIQRIPSIVKPELKIMSKLINNIIQHIPRDYLYQRPMLYEGPYEIQDALFIGLVATEYAKIEESPQVANLQGNIIALLQGESNDLSQLLQKGAKDFNARLKSLKGLARQKEIEGCIREIGDNMSYVIWVQLKQLGKEINNMLLQLVIMGLITMIYGTLFHHLKEIKVIHVILGVALLLISTAMMVNLVKKILSLCRVSKDVITFISR